MPELAVCISMMYEIRPAKVGQHDVTEISQTDGRQDTADKAQGKTLQGGDASACL